MGQKGFFDVERRLEAISAKGDPLETIKRMVRWEDFRADIEAVTETKPEERKSNAGRKPYDTILKFKIVVLQSLHNLSDEQTEYLIRDRISFMRFLDLELEDPVPDATTIWLFREALAQAGLIDRLVLMTFPVLLGRGKRIFDGSQEPSGLKLADSFTSSTGVVTTIYEPAGEVRTGTFATKEPSEDELELRDKIKEGTW